MTDLTDAIEKDDAAIQASTPTAEATLTIHDRCDSCGAQAYVQVTLKTGELLFCNHHYKTNKEVLDKAALVVLDESWQLSKPLDVSA